MRVEIGLMSQGFNSDGIEFNSTKDGLCVVLGCVFEGVCSFESRGEEAEVFRES